jgi:hypothetical protein
MRDFGVTGQPAKLDTPAELDQPDDVNENTDTQSDNDTDLKAGHSEAKLTLTTAKRPVGNAKMKQVNVVPGSGSYRDLLVPHDILRLNIRSFETSAEFLEELKHIQFIDEVDDNDFLLHLLTQENSTKFDFKRIFKYTAYVNSMKLVQRIEIPHGLVLLEFPVTTDYYDMKKYPPNREYVYMHVSNLSKAWNKFTNGFDEADTIKEMLQVYKEHSGHWVIEFHAAVPCT